MPVTLGLSESLSVLVKSKYHAAKAAEALSFAATELAIVQVTGVPFQLRYCPSLAKKPNSKPESGESTPLKKTDPFENPSQDLLVGRVPVHNPTHNIVLNKFPIIQNHFILATKENKEQTHLLEKDDLAVTLQCLREWNGAEQESAKSNRLFAFFNSGDHSGASQPHRHVQFLPVDDIAEGDSNNEWTLLADKIMAMPSSPTKDSTPSFRIDSQLPFVHFGLPLPNDPTAEELHEIYVKLYDASLSAVENYISNGAKDLELHSTEASDLPISYNLGMTSDSMVICPRRREGEAVKRRDGTEIDTVALNGTLLGGTLMVKNEELWHLLRDDAKRLGGVLEDIGIPPTKLTYNL